MPVRLLASSWPPMLLGLAAVVVTLLWFDVPADLLAGYTAYLLLGIALPGVFTWRLLLRGLHTRGRPPTWFEDLSLGTIFGFGVQLPFFLVGVALGAHWLPVLAPALVLVLGLTGFGRDVWRLPTRRMDARASWALAGVVAYGMAWLGREVLGRRPLGIPLNRTPSVDETFHQALIADVGNRFPPEIPFLLGVRLDYHWFVHAQIAASNALTGLDSVTMIRLVMPSVVLVLAVLGLGAAALRLTGRPVAAVIAPALLVAGAYHLLGPSFAPATFHAPYLSPRFVSSPSQSYGVMMSMPAVMLLLEVLRPRRRADRLTWLALALALLALSGSKATFLPIFVCGALAVWGVQLLRTRRIDRTATALVVLLVAVTVFAQVVLFGGQSGSMLLDPGQSVVSALRSQGIEPTTLNQTLMTGTLLVGWLLYGVGVLGLWRRLLDPRAVWLLVAVPAGITIPFLFFRTGLSQYWFSRSVAELVVLLSAWGMAVLLPRPLTTRTALRLGAVAAVACAAGYTASALMERARGGSGVPTTGSMLVTVAVPVGVLLVWLLLRLAFRLAGRRGRPGLLLVLTVLLGLSLVNVAELAVHTARGDRIAMLRLKQTTPLFARGGVEAASYIAENSSVDDIVATNVHCLHPDADRCDNRSFWVAAYTERRVVVQGWGYTAVTNAMADGDTNSQVVPMPYPERLAVNDAAFSDPSEESVRRLVDTYDVSWLFVSRKYPADISGLRELDDLLVEAYRGPGHVVFEVRD
ncbi:MAG TPA: hypothetical protein VLA97_07585 [Nocardioidaceae bacterium]|nr:hypothetical protein [Nocardioidaceae bacterium]